MGDYVGLGFVEYVYCYGMLQQMVDDGFSQFWDFCSNIIKGDLFVCWYYVGDIEVGYELEVYYIVVLFCISVQFCYL